MLWRPNVYDLILLDVRRLSPGEALQFYEQVKDASPRERLAFLFGPPVYLSLKWPEEVKAAQKERPQPFWSAMVKRFSTAA